MELATLLRFDPGSPFCQFSHIRIQDGTSFALKSGGILPGTVAHRNRQRWSYVRTGFTQRVVSRPALEP